MTFDMINRITPIEDVRKMYDAYHEMDIRHFEDALNERRARFFRPPLRMRRMVAKLSQAQLARHLRRAGAQIQSEQRRST